MLQQYLPFTVLKRSRLHLSHFIGCKVATVLTVYGIETKLECALLCHIQSCSSPYRLRY